MAFQVPYSTDTVRIPDALIPGNENSDNPVEFDIAPAWGPDTARLKSIVMASAGLVDDSGVGQWSPDVQAAVIGGFTTGAPAFVNTVLAIRGLTVPARMALRAGLIAVLTPGQTPDTPIPVLTGADFARLAGALTAQAMFVAMKIISLTGKQDIDPRFFVQPSGSGGIGTPSQPPTTAASVRRTSRRRATAASQAQTASPAPGTLPSSS